jgi:hypothetical protein
MRFIDSIFDGDHNTKIERIIAEQRTLVNKITGLDEIFLGGK